MAVLRSCKKNEEQSTHHKAGLPGGYQHVQRKLAFGSFALAWWKMLAIDPCNPKASRDSTSNLWNKTLTLHKGLILSNTECLQRKRKLEQFLRGSSFIAASGWAAGTSSNKNVKKLDSVPFSSVSCLPKSVVTTECFNTQTVQNSTQTVQNSYSEGSALIVEDSFQGKQEDSNFNSPDNATNWGPSSTEISPYIDSDESVNGSKPLSPENLIVQDAPLKDSNDLVRSSDPLTTEEKLDSEKDVIPVGPKFQAELPKWTGPVKKGNHYDDDGNSENLKWLGTRIWPMEGRSTKTTTEAVGKGRPDSCSCVSPGTSDCIKHHVFEARKLLQSNLGPAFFSWKFNEMGEVVSKSWTLKEQKKFESLVKKNPMLNGTNFWESASNCFASKCKRSILSYYYNVFLPRRMSLLTRSSLNDVDSDEDRIDVDEEVEDEELSVMDCNNAKFPTLLPKVFNRITR